VKCFAPMRPVPHCGTEEQRVTASGPVDKGCLCVDNGPLLGKSLGDAPDVFPYALAIIENE